jgi:tripartite-type tricarboxylate transporter receptor subunit TctC
VTSARALADAARRSDVAEGRLPGYDMPAWRSIMGPAGMPADVVAILNKAIQQALASPDLRDRFMQGGLSAAGSTPSSCASATSTGWAFRERSRRTRRQAAIN